MYSSIFKRDFNGDINGEFWFGIQKSTDIEKLCNIEKERLYCWEVCGCLLEYEENYCIDHFSSYNEHMLSFKEEKESNPFCKNRNNKLYFPIDYYRYVIDKESHYNQIKKSLLELEEQIDNSTFELIVSDTNYHILFTKDYKNNMKNNKLVARYCLGHLILNNLKYNEVCVVNCQF